MAGEFATYPELAGRSALIIGAAGGLGYSLAEAFAANGCHVTLSDINAETLSGAASELRAGYPTVQFESVVASVTDEVSLNAAFDHAVDAFGGIDIALCAAGISANRPSLELSANEWRRVIDIDLTGAFLTARAAAVRMQDRGGLILNLSSMWGVAASPERAAYCAAKAGVGAMTASLAVEWASYNIRVNAIGPGYTQTNLTDELVAQGRIQTEVIEQATPLGRFGTLDEVANVGLFLASDGARFITGQTIVSDGGWTSNGYLPSRLNVADQAA